MPIELTGAHVGSVEAGLLVDSDEVAVGVEVGVFLPLSCLSYL